MSDEQQDPKPETGIQKRMKNLIPYRKGVSGNPKGRPVTKPITDAYMNALNVAVPDELLTGALEKFKGTGITALEVMAMNQVRIAIDQNPKGKHAAIAAAKELADRVEGKVPLRVSQEHSGTVEVQLTDDQRKARLLEIAQKATNEDVIDAEFEDVPEPNADDIG